MAAIRNLQTAYSGNDFALDDISLEVIGTVESPVPEPATLAIWSLLGLSGAGMWVVRRRKAVGGADRVPWSEENRVAICQLIERGRS